jgi:Mn2+/Fe2+ NRAMP family transporter
MKNLILILNQLLAQHAWVKFALEIFLLALAAGVLRAISLRLFKRAYLNWKHKNLVLALVERTITPILVIAVLSVSFNSFPLSVKLLSVLNRAFYNAVNTDHQKGDS